MQTEPVAKWYWHTLALTTRNNYIGSLITYIECLCHRPSPAVSFPKQRNSTPTWCFTTFRASFYRCAWQHHIYQPQDFSKQRNCNRRAGLALFWKSLKSLGAATPGGCHQIAWWLGSVADDFVRQNPHKFSWDVTRWWPVGRPCSKTCGSFNGFSPSLQCMVVGQVPTNNLHQVLVALDQDPSKIHVIIQLDWPH